MILSRGRKAKASDGHFQICEYHFYHSSMINYFSTKGPVSKPCNSPQITYLFTNKQCSYIHENFFMLYLLLLLGKHQIPFISMEETFRNIGAKG